MTFSVLQYGVGTANTSTHVGTATALQPPAPNVISTNSSGAPLLTTLGSTLILFGGLDLSAANSTAPVPSFSVTDSADNFWIPLTLSQTTNQAARGTIWVCFNALPVTWVSAAPNGYCSSDITLLVEFGGLPTYPQIDFIATPNIVVGTSITNTATSTQPGIVFSLLTVGSTSFSSITTPASFSLIDQVSTGGTDPNGVTVSAAWSIVTGAGSVSATWGISPTNSAMASVMVGFSQAQSPHVPVLANPNFPKTRVEMAFGTNPADPTNNIGIYGTGSLPSSGWTDISARSIGKAGNQCISGLSGKTYELGQPEAGTCDIGLNNWDGAFNPANTASPYYPHVLLNTPVRVSSWWNGRWNPLFTGFVAKFPQEWPDLPQFGLSNMQCVDMVSIASTTNMPSAVQGEILADAPYACFPFSEQYTTTVQDTGFVGSQQTPTECDGLIAVNTSQTNQKTAVYKDGLLNSAVLAPVITGQTLSLLGDAGTGMGCAAFPAPQQAFRGAGAMYMDNASTAPQFTGNGFTLEMIANVPSTNFSFVTGGTNVTLAQVFGEPALVNSPSNSQPTAGSILVFVQQSAAGVWGLNVWGYPQNAGPVAVGPINVTSLMNTSMHIMVDVTATSITVFLNGANVGNVSWTAPLVQTRGWVWGNARWPFTYDQFNFNYSIAYGTIYPYQVQANRALAHYEAALLGFAGESPLQRFGRLLAWSGVNMGAAAWPVLYPNQVQMGAAYDTAGSSLGDALNNLTLTDGGMWYANCTGNLVFASRQALFNQPSTVTFGDSNTAGAEVPYEPGFGIDYDNTYLNNVVQGTQQNGPATLLAPIEKSVSSEQQYFQRGPLAQTVSSTSAQDAYDRTYWSLNKYQQPTMRVRTMQVDCASTPSSFTQCFATGIGDVATVNRRPMGATATYSLLVLIQQVGFQIGPSVFQFGYVGTPYTAEAGVLQADEATYDVLGNNVLAW